jgi:serine phosphatase RsbU (regulator of sigma subunit)
LQTRLIFLLFLLSFFFQKMFGQSYTSFELVDYTSSDYDSHSQNWDIANDDFGNLYVANGDGILEYDGKEWELIKTEKEATVLSLIKSTNDNRIYVGAVNEFGYIEPDKFGNMEFHSLSDRLPDSLQNFGNVWRTKHLNSNTYFISNSTLYIYNERQDTLFHHHALGGFEESCVFNNRFFINDDTFGLYEVNADHTLTLLPKTDKELESLSISGVFKHSDDELLIFSNTEMFLYSLSKHTLTHLETELGQSIQNETVICIEKLNSGEFALGTRKYGLIIVSDKGEILDNYTSKDSPLLSSISRVKEDVWGNLWVASNKGIAKIGMSSPFTRLISDVHFSGIANVVQKSNDLVYLGTTEGMYQINKKDILNPDKNHVKQIGDIYTQCFDIATYDDVALFSSTNGIFIVKNGEIVNRQAYYTRALLKTKLPDELLAVGGRNRFWIYRYDAASTSLKELVSIEDFPDEVLTMVHDTSVKDSLVIWAGLFSNGVARVSFPLDLSDYSMQVYSTNHGFREGYVTPFQLNDDIYFVTKFQEVHRYDKEKDTFYPDELITKILGTQSPYLVNQDQQGNLYLELPSSMAIVNKDLEVDSITFKGLGIGYLNYIHIDKENTVWMAWEGALIHFDPKGHKINRKEYHTLIRSVTFSDAIQLGIYEHSNISYDNNNVIFNFTSPYFENNKELQYSYRLLGYNETFSEWKKERKAAYTNLYEGKYTFEVKAINNKGIESTVAAYSFTILPPWYRTVYAYFLYLILLILLVYLLLILNSKRLRAANLRLQKIIKEKTHEIVKQRDALKLQNEEIEEQKKNLEERNRDILDSITYAKRIQRALLPPENKVTTHLPDHFIFFRPKDIVSGDFYWAYEKNYEGNRYWYVTVADCTGHGVPGAFLTMLGTSFLNEIILEDKLLQPAEILDLLREKIIHNLGQKGDKDDSRDGMDMSIIRLNLDTLELSFAGANNPLWIVSEDGELRETKADSQPVSYQEHSTAFTNHLVPIHPGETMYLFSDGFSDQFGGESHTYLSQSFNIERTSSKLGGKKFKSSNFKRMLSTLAQEQDMNKQKETILEIFNNWKGDIEQIDDVCIIGIRV